MLTLKQLVKIITYNLQQQYPGFRFTQAKVHRIFRAFLDTVEQELVNDGSVTLYGFGTFSVVDRKPRRYYSFAKDTYLVKDAYKAPKLTYSDVFKRTLN